MLASAVASIGRSRGTLPQCSALNTYLITSLSEQCPWTGQCAWDLGRPIVGRPHSRAPNRYHVFRHGLSSAYEAIFRLSLVSDGSGAARGSSLQNPYGEDVGADGKGT